MRATLFLAVAVALTSVTIACANSDRITSVGNKPGTRSTPSTPSTPTTSPTPGAPAYVDQFGWGFALMSTATRLGAPAGVVVFDAARVPVPNAPVRFEITRGAATVDSASARTDQNGVASFGALRLPATPDSSVLRVSVNGTPMAEFPLIAADAETNDFGGTFELTSLDGTRLPMEITEPTYHVLESLIGATLTCTATHYELVMTIERRDGVRVTVRAAGRLASLRPAQGLQNLSFFPDGLPAGTYFDQNPAFLARDGRLEVLNLADDGWPLPGMRADFVRQH